MKFYEKCLGAELELTTFGLMSGNAPKEAQDRIMHARLSNGSTLLMASDLMPGMPYNPGSNISIAIQCDSLLEIERMFTKLSENGSVTMPPAETSWAARFGMLRDRPLDAQPLPAATGLASGWPIWPGGTMPIAAPRD
jgi:PhnB protein